MNQKLSDKELGRITYIIFNVSPDALLFDNVPSDMTWGELVQLVGDLLGRGSPPGDAPAPDYDASFGDPEGPAWQRGHFENADEGEPLVEMACCGFRFSSYHSDDSPDNREGHVIGGSLTYSCPMCAPGGAAAGSSAPPECESCHALRNQLQTAQTKLRILERGVREEPPAP